MREGLGSILVLFKDSGETEEEFVSERGASFGE